MRTDRRSPDFVDADAEADIDEFDKLISDSTPSVVAESQALASGISRRVSEVRSVGAVNDQILAALYEADVAHGSAVTTGVLVAALAMGAAHGRGERVNAWPTTDGIVARDYWQRAAGWTDNEYAEAVSSARKRAYAAHSGILLQLTNLAADVADAIARKLFRLDAAEQTVYEAESLDKIWRFMRDDGERMVVHRAGLIADAEPSAVYALQKYTTQLEIAGEDDVLVYVTRDDGRVRPNHRTLHMKAWPAKSPVWRRIYPPNGMRCRCTAVLRNRTWVSDNLRSDAIRTTVPRGGGPDKGFSRDPRARRKTDVSRYGTAHVSALAGAHRA